MCASVDYVVCECVCILVLSLLLRGFCVFLSQGTLYLMGGYYIDSSFAPQFLMDIWTLNSSGVWAQMLPPPNTGWNERCASLPAPCVYVAVILRVVCVRCLVLQGLLRDRRVRRPDLHQRRDKLSGGLL